MPDGIRVKRPDGKTGRIPAEDLPAALREGYTVVREAEPKSPIPENYGFTTGNVLKNVVQGVKNIAQIPLAVGESLMSGPEPTTALLRDFVINPSIEQFKKAAREEDPIARFGSGLGAAIPFIGPWAAGLGEQAGTGDIGGALARGGTEVGTIKAVIKVPAAVGGVRTAIGDALPRNPRTGEIKPLIPAAINKLFPESEVRVRAREMEQRAQDLVRREREQALLDKRAATAELAKERVRRMQAKAEMEQAKAHEAALAEDYWMGRSRPNQASPESPLTPSEAARLRAARAGEQRSIDAAHEQALVENFLAGRSNPATATRPPQPSVGVVTEDIWAGRSKPPKLQPPRPPEPARGSDFGAGARPPSALEARLTELLQKEVLSLEEMTELQRAFGKDWSRLRGEGVTDMQARLLGMLRARRSARGMIE